MTVCCAVRECSEETELYSLARMLGLLSRWVALGSASLGFPSLKRFLKYSLKRMTFYCSSTSALRCSASTILLTISTSTYLCVCSAAIFSALALCAKILASSQELELICSRVLKPGFPGRSATASLASGGTTVGFVPIVGPFRPLLSASCR